MRQLRLSPCSNTTQSVLSAIGITWVRGWLAQDAIRLAESRSATAILRLLGFMHRFCLSEQHCAPSHGDLKGLIWPVNTYRAAVCAGVNVG